MKKALLVCSVHCPEVEKRLTYIGYRFVEVSDGLTAVERVEVETFDAAIVVSTGPEMDPLETVFNIKDLTDSMPIYIVRPSQERDVEQERLFPYVKWCCISELQYLL